MLDRADYALELDLRRRDEKAFRRRRAWQSSENARALLA